LITVDTLGCARFREDYGVRAAYVAGAMVKGIASTELVTRMARSGRLSFYGSGGMRLSETEAAIREIQGALRNGEPYGVNVLANASRPQEEMEIVDLMLRLGVHNAEASAFMQVSPALVKFRLTGIDTDSKGRVIAPNRMIAKLSRPEVAEAFLSPAPQPMVDRLLAGGHITAQEAALSPRLPVASDLCVEADSGGHTDMGVMSVLLPAIIRLRDSIQEQRAYQDRVRVGAAGGIGSPEASASSFLLGADFILTGSINQCSVEAGTSDAVKDMLQGIGVRDTAYAPAGDMFEMGSKIQVMKKGVFFPARASKLYDLWRTHGAIEQIDAATRSEIQDKYYRRSFEEAYRETKNFYMAEFPAEIERAERNPKARMALIFRWYFVHTMRLALEGTRDRHVDYQVHTGPAIGAFNQWVAGTPLEDWRKRHVDTIADHLMQSCAEYMNRKLGSFAR
jgi:trans-AT polyketide synthase/acyltransferase/oxidoreductase domain-containing protein